MKREVEDIIDALESRQWDSRPDQRAIELACSAPKAFVELLTLAMQQDVRAGHVLTEALSFLPSEYWPSIIPVAFAVLEAGDNEVAQGAVACVALQFPELLLNLRERILELWERSIDIPRGIWRRADDSDIAFLKETVESTEATELVRFLAWDALMSTTRPAVMSWCIENDNVDFGSHLKRINAPDDRIEELRARAAIHYLKNFDCEFVAGNVRMLTSYRTLHMVLPRGYFHDRPNIHPTYFKQGEFVIGDHQFGGQAEERCALCNDFLSLMVRLNPIPEGIGATDLSLLNIVTCLRCLGWVTGPLFYNHAADGSFGPVNNALPPHSDYNSFPSQASFAPSPLQLTETAARWNRQDWGESNGKQNLFRIGGRPCWIQNPDYLICPSCGVTMTYLMEFDSFIPTSEGGEFLWGSGGAGYFYWCDACKISGAIWQCT